jgi:anti-sigma regulatory factor (Ser/Thr protein kinase)
LGPVTIRPVEDLGWVAVTDPAAPGALRLLAERAARDVGFEPARSADVALAMTEAASNLERHASDGAIVLQILRDGDAAGLRFIAVDRGPGMADPDRARHDGFSTRGTLGIGLGAIERLASESHLHSVPGRGTVLAAVFWPRGGPPQRDAAAITRPITGEETCGDAYAERRDGPLRSHLLVDGLGHGPLAAAAANTAVQLFGDAPAGPPARLLEWMHARLGGTRGAAAAIAEVDGDRGVARFAGIGNISGWIHDGERRRGMTSHPGILGHQARKFAQFDYELPTGAIVVLHSDGLTEKWDLADYPGLRARHPVLTAATLLRDAGIRHDDASIAVLRASA